MFYRAFFTNSMCKAIHSILYACSEMLKLFTYLREKQRKGIRGPFRDSQKISMNMNMGIYHSGGGVYLLLVGCVHTQRDIQRAKHHSV